jgi:hypothetical protein
MTLLGHAGAWDCVVAWLPKVPRIRSATEVGAVGDRLDQRVHDSVALDEIELYSEVLSAVAASDHRLTVEELDQVLGVRSVALCRSSRAAYAAWRRRLGCWYGTSPKCN